MSREFHTFDIMSTLIYDRKIIGFSFCLKDNNCLKQEPFIDELQEMFFTLNYNKTRKMRLKMVIIEIEDFKYKKNKTRTRKMFFFRRSSFI